MAGKPPLTPSRVFVPGGMPIITYIPRAERELESKLRSVEDNLCKLVTLTGSTKSGKTVLANRIFPRSSGNAIWLDGGSIDTEETFWRELHSNFDEDEEIVREVDNKSESAILGEVSGQGGIPLLANVKGGGKLERKDGWGNSRQTKPVLGIKARTIRMLRESRLPLIVDDFHYLDRKSQGAIVRALKPLVFEGHPVIFIAIPHRRYDVVRVEKEMTGRVLSIPVPSWTESELLQIGEAGFPRLSIDLNAEINARLAAEAYGSPHLMQEFCREVATDRLGGNELRTHSLADFRGDILFKKSAEATGKIIFDKLAKGPRQRTDRLQRPLVGGGTADIYRVILLALSHISPGLNVIDYEVLRNAIRSILTDKIPQVNEVTRVLEKMAEIASKDESSVSVLDWDSDEQKLHITDPFFAFFLKWSEDYIRSQPIISGYKAQKSK